MKDTDIQIAKVYDIKIGKNTTAVRITKCLPTGGWEGITLSSHKTMVIKSSKRILGLHKSQDAPAGDAGKPKKKSPKPAQTKKSANTPQPEAKKRLSALDAAVKVLTEISGAMNSKQLVDTMAEKNYWKPTQAGKTPANTLHAAISKEINTKGTDSRFVKVGRGKFGLNHTA